ncbi:MAG: esterase family protein [Clostridiaceae bacterium]|nr:esterase family protein [Clostridiaceae bacterium]
MALLDLNFYSYILGMDCSAYVLLPGKRMYELTDRSSETFPVLYLLHGHGDDETAFIRKSVIEILAREHDLVVVMPNAHRSFYRNESNGFRYEDFFVHELPLHIKNYFRVSDKREDTFIAGLSMGGYGAFRLAMKYPEKYSAACSMSGAMSAPYGMIKKDPVDDFYYYFNQNVVRIYGDDTQERELWTLAESLNKNDSLKPRLLQTCGTSDVLYESNVEFAEYMEKQIQYSDFTFLESEGAHDWDFWNRSLRDVLNFLGFKTESKLETKTVQEV